MLFWGGSDRKEIKESRNPSINNTTSALPFFSNLQSRVTVCQTSWTTDIDVCSPTNVSTRDSNFALKLVFVLTQYLCSYSLRVRMVLYRVTPELLSKYFPPLKSSIVKEDDRAPFTKIEKSRKTKSFILVFGEKNKEFFGFDVKNPPLFFVCLCFVIIFFFSRVCGKLETCWREVVTNLGGELRY